MRVLLYGRSLNRCCAFGEGLGADCVGQVLGVRD
jgi:hypothetical protein